MPSRLSRMISSLAAASRPPPKPSATLGQTVLMQRAPVNSALPPSASAAAARSGTACRNPETKQPDSSTDHRTGRSETSGARAQFCGFAPCGCGIGSRVRKATAVLRSSSHSFMVAPGVIVLELLCFEAFSSREPVSTSA